jgi:putative CocE/NonD family hydrolase
MFRVFVATSFALFLIPSASSQQFAFSATDAKAPAALSNIVKRLAAQALPVYREADRATYLVNLATLQVAAGQNDKAVQTYGALRDYRRSAHIPNPEWRDLQYEIYAQAKSISEKQSLPFEKSYEEAFRSVFSKLDNVTAAQAAVLFTTIDEKWMAPSLQSDLDAQQGKSSITLEAAVSLIHDYEAAQAYRETATLRGALITEDDSRRYVIEKDILIKTVGGAKVCADVARQRGVTEKLPALFVFSIYYDPSDTVSTLRMPTAHGYASVAAFTRGKACSPDRPVPYEHDGEDAASVIDWITAQPWSDGRVGMYSGSYNGFTQWATAKYMPKGLKAMMAGAPAGPGIDVPMENNVFWNFMYPWPFYTTDGKANDDKTYGNSRRWQKLDHDWYASGRAYRDLDKIDGTPNPVFDKWIAHPSYDAYWQNLLPNKQEFARINIPTLITIGYYAGGPGAGLYYFGQTEKYNPGGEHYLLVGPYGHIEAQYGPFGLMGNSIPSISGLKLDPVAVVDMIGLRYQWFDYIFRNGPRPDLLKDKVNYEVTGADTWQHASSVDSMSSARRRLYLSGARNDHGFQLRDRRDAQESAATLRVDLADRSDVDRKSIGGGVSDKELDTWNGIEFISEPLTQATKMSGLFSGHLDFITNKKDFDFEIDLYELTPLGDYVQLAPYWSRASYVADHSHRHLLTPNKKQHLDFQSIRLMGRQLQRGSRIVAVLSVLKSEDRQINYGTGKDVSDERIQDAGAPLVIHWSSNSYLDLPLGR